MGQKDDEGREVVIEYYHLDQMNEIGELLNWNIQTISVKDQQQLDKELRKPGFFPVDLLGDSLVPSNSGKTM